MINPNTNAQISPVKHPFHERVGSFSVGTGGHQLIKRQKPPAMPPAGAKITPSTSACLRSLFSARTARNQTAYEITIPIRHPFHENNCGFLSEGGQSIKIPLNMPIIAPISA